MIALPFFASLGRPRPARGAAAAQKRRFVGFYLPCGIVMSNWTPAAEGAGWSSPILAPLAPYASHTLVLSGVSNVPGRSDGGGDHAAGTGAFLTATHVRKTANADILNGISVDQLLAPVLLRSRPPRRRAARRADRLGRRQAPARLRAEPDARDAPRRRQRAPRRARPALPARPRAGRGPRAAGHRPRHGRGGPLAGQPVGRRDVPGVAGAGARAVVAVGRRRHRAHAAGRRGLRHARPSSPSTPRWPRSTRCAPAAARSASCRTCPGFDERVGATVEVRPIGGGKSVVAVHGPLIARSASHVPPVHCPAFTARRITVRRCSPRSQRPAPSTSGLPHIAAAGRSSTAWYTSRVCAMISRVTRGGSRCAASVNA
jgi:hypothetical protein